MSFAVLGLDLSTTSTGWAVLDYEHRNVIDSGTITPIGGLGQRIATIADFVDNLCPRRGVSDAYIEKAFARNGTTTIKLGMVHGAVLHALYRRGIEPGYLAPTEIKKHATFHGGATKADMIAAAVERWPHTPPAGDDEADAMWVADLGCHRIEQHVKGMA